MTNIPDDIHELVDIDKTPAPKYTEPTNSQSFNWGALLLLIAIVGGLGLFCVYMTSPTSSEIKNVTVIEKYPAEYRGPSEKIIDENGNVYFFTKYQLWAKMRINQTYEIRAFKTRGEPDQKIDAIRMNEVWYY